MSFESDRTRSIDSRDEARGPGAGTGRTIGRTPILLAALGVIAALAIAISPTDAQPLVTRLVILVLGVVAVWKVLGRSAAVTASSPERFELDLRQPLVPATEIAGLRSVETDLRMSTASAFGLEFRLKPLLRDLASWRLSRNHGIDLATAPDAARRVLGEPLCDLILPADAFPEFRLPGAPLDDVQAGLDRLERI